MSTLKIFSIRDLKAGQYGQPFAFQNRGVAMRTFSNWCANPESFFSKFPSDFELFELGEFDLITGKYTELPTPDYVGRASDLVPSAS